jgi:hypothetical protein
MPRAALLSIHARMAGAVASTWEDPSLVQLWGPRYSVFVIAAQDVAVFSLGTLPDDARGRSKAYDLADRLAAVVGGKPIRYGDAGDRVGLGHANSLRYAAATGRVLIRWEGARQPTIWTVPAPSVEPDDARLELARRHLHIYGPTTPDAFGAWSGIGPRPAFKAFRALGRSLIRVATPIGEAWILRSDEADARRGPGPTAPARLLPSGDAYFLLQGPDRELLVPEIDRRAALWTPRVWPGALLVGGELTGTWRRADNVLVVRPWRALSRAEADAVGAEAEGLPLPLTRPISVRWEE